MQGIVKLSAIDPKSQQYTFLVWNQKNFFAPFCRAGADKASKFRGGDFSNIWQSSLIMVSLL